SSCRLYLDAEIFDNRIGEQLLRHLLHTSPGTSFVRLVQSDREIFARPHILHRLEPESLQAAPDREAGRIIDDRLQRDEDFSLKHASPPADARWSGAGAPR